MGSDEQMPAWAQAMEARAEARDHHLVTELTGALAELRAEMTRRFDQTHDDLTVNLARADVAIEQRLEGDVRKELSQRQRRLRELEHWRNHRPDAGQSP